MQLRHLILASALPLACSTGEVVSTGGTSDLTSSAGSSAGSSGSASTTDLPTTGATDEDGTTGTDMTSTTSTTTGEASSGSSGGPICEPGTANCECDAGTCTGDLLCVDDVCVAEMTCGEGLGEPDDLEPDAHDLGEITDDDSKTLAADGVLGGIADRDWYTYHGLDTFGYTADPTVKLTTSGSLRLCQFLECDNGGVAKTTLTCPMGTQEALSGELRPGCCGGPVFTISDFTCDGVTDNVRVYIRIDKAAEDVCIDYSLSLHN